MMQGAWHPGVPSGTKGCRAWIVLETGLVVSSCSALEQTTIWDDGMPLRSLATPQRHTRRT
jgi:hypothetical protein